MIKLRFGRPLIAALALTAATGAILLTCLDAFGPAIARKLRRSIPPVGRLETAVHPPPAATQMRLLDKQSFSRTSLDSVGVVELTLIWRRVLWLSAANAMGIATLFLYILLRS